MPAKVVIVTTEPAFAQDVAALLLDAGHDSVTPMDSMRALDELERAQKIELLITCADFAVGQATGLSLARIARLKRPNLKVIFIGSAEHERYVAGVGLFMQSPATAVDVSDQALRLLNPGDNE